MRMIRLTVILAMVVGALTLVGSPGGAQTPTCFGMDATIVAEPGKTTRGTRGPDVIVGTNGVDKIRARGGDDKVCAKRGNDDIKGGGGDDMINAGGGHDIAEGGSGDDMILGKRGRDGLYGNGGVDILIGGGAADQLFGGGKGDELFGNAGNDTLRGGNGNDECTGGAGVNTLLNCNDKDTNRIVAAAKVIDDAAVQGDGAAAWAAAAYPIGEWTEADLACFSSVVIGTIRQSSIEPTPGWRIPSSGQPGGGTVPDGRIYSFHFAAGIARAHATIIGGQAYFFPRPC